MDAADSSATVFARETWSWRQRGNNNKKIKWTTAWQWQESDLFYLWQINTQLFCNLYEKVSYMGNTDHIGRRKITVGGKVFLGAILKWRQHGEGGGGTQKADDCTDKLCECDSDKERGNFADVI